MAWPFRPSNEGVAQAEAAILAACYENRLRRIHDVCSRIQTGPPQAHEELLRALRVIRAIATGDA